MRRSFRGRVGTQRITKNLRPSQASYTREIRAQMQGIEEEVSAIINQLKGVTPVVLEDALRPTFEKSQFYCPKDTHALVNSGYLEAHRTPSGIHVEIGYGKGGDPHYAVFVHEMTSYYHETPTRAKFLQVAIQEDADAIPERILSGYKASVGI